MFTRVENLSVFGCTQNTKPKRVLRLILETWRLVKTFSKAFCGRWSGNTIRYYRVRAESGPRRTAPITTIRCRRRLSTANTDLWLREFRANEFVLYATEKGRRDDANGEYGNVNCDLREVCVDTRIYGSVGTVPLFHLSAPRFTAHFLNPSAR